jgi:hypothetical protein
MGPIKGDKPDDVRLRRELLDGVIEEWSPAMGRVFTTPADPRPRTIDLSADAAGWEPWQTFLRRMRR